MKTQIFGLIFFSLSFLFISCQKQSEKVEPIFQDVETLLEQHPDSALVLLEEIPNPQSLKKSLYYQYYLLQLQAKDKSYRDITSDTLIFGIQKYYEKKDDIEKAALASFYSGRVRQEQKQYGKALEIYLDAEKYLEHSNNNNLKGLVQSSIGSIYDEELIQNSAIAHFKKANELFGKAQNYRNEIITGNLIGNCFLKEGEADSAFSYYFKALAFADSLGYEEEQAAILESLGVAYRETEDWNKAEDYFRKAWNFAADSLERARTLLNMACLFDEMGKRDSATHYIQSSLSFLPNNDDNYLAANIFETWSAISEKSGDFQDALEKYKIYSDYLVMIFDENRDQEVLKIEKKYNYQFLENRNKQLTIERQRIILLSLLLFLMLVAIIFVGYRHSVQNEKKLKEAEQRIYQMKEMARNFNEKENSFRNILIRHFDIIKKTALLEGYLKEDEKKQGKHLLRKFNEVVYGEKNLDWDLLYETLNRLNNGFFEQIKNRFSNLDQTEFRICCLQCIDLNNTEIGLMLNYSTNTIRAKKSVIRKKLGVKAFGDINDFIETTLRK